MATPSVNNKTSGGGTGSSTSFSHTVSSKANRLLFVVIAKQGTSRTVSSCTYGGNALTLLYRRDYSSGQAQLDVYVMIAPPSGSATVSVTLNGSVSHSVGAYDLYDANQSPGDFSFVDSAGVVTSISVNVGSTEEDLILCMAAKKYDDIPASNSGQTILIKEYNGSAYCLSDSKPGEGDGSTNIGYNSLGGRYMILAGVAVPYLQPSNSSGAIIF